MHIPFQKRRPATKTSANVEKLHYEGILLVEKPSLRWFSSFSFAEAFGAG